MSFIRKLLAATLAAAMVAHAADKKEDKKKETPQVLMALPFAVIAGETNTIVIRGLLLTNATAVHFPSVSNFTAEILKRSKATMPDKGDPKRLGDTQLEVQLVLPNHFATGDLPFAVTTSEGETNTNLLYVVSHGVVFDEKEPNGSFRKPNDVTVPQTIRGTIQEANDVDVFRFKGKAGQRISLETKSVRYGSTLDPILTLYDSNGHVLKTSDDADGLDASLSFLVPRDGDYFFAINDAHDRGGMSYGYVIELRDTIAKP